MEDNMSPEQIYEMQKQNCIFCKIIKGEIPSSKVFEDEKSIIILDINPASKGHMLVLPKEHYQIMPQVPKDVMGHLFITAKKASKAILKGMAMNGTTIFVANGAIAGQKAPHFMIHVIPRDEADTLFNIPKNNASKESLEEVKSKILSRLKPKELPKPRPMEPPKQIEPKKEEPQEEPEEEPEKDKDDAKKDPLNIDDIASLFL